MAKIRILIADDHALFRSGLRALLAAQPDFEIVGEAEDGASASERSKKLAPDVVLMDLTMPGRGGIKATEDLRRTCPTTRILALTMHEDAPYARQALRAGAAGFVLKKALATELIAAIRAVHAGKHYVTPALAAALAEMELDEPRRAANPTGLDLLSEREREVVGLIALGYTNAETAGRLHISEKTVESHRAHVLTKLGLQTRADLVRFALEHGLMQA